jgi:hypothetical protein
MVRSWIGPMVLILLGALAPACATPCQNARARIESRYTECGIEAAEPPLPASEVCSSNDGEFQKCIADCTESVTCEGLTGADELAAGDFDECYVDCSL